MNDSTRPYWERWAERPRTRRRFLVGASAAALGTAALGLVGCGDDDDEQEGTGPTTQPTGAAGAPKAGGELLIAYGLEPSSLDPHAGVSGGDHFFFEDMFNFLVAHDAGNELDASISLAESWQIEDEQTIVFNLRQGVQFHDGSPFDSEIVAWNIERVKDPDTKSTARSTFLVVDRVETPDPQTARFILTEPSAGLLSLLGGRGGAIVSRQAVETLGEEFRSTPVGTGPFAFDEWLPGGHVKMKKNPSYWRTDAAGIPTPYLDRVTIRIIPDSTAALAALQTGDVHLGGIDPKDLEQVKSIADIQVIQREGSGIASQIIMNRQAPPSDNLDFRRAVMHAVDPQALLQSVFFGNAIVADGGMWPPGTWAYKPVASRPTYDPAKAKQYLEASGVTDTDLDLMTWESRTIIQQGEVYQEQLRQVGIKSQITTLAVGPATQAFFEGTDYEMYTTSWSLYPEPDWIANTIYDEAAYYNTGKSQTSEVTSLIKQGRAEYDTEKRKEIYQQMAELVIADMYHVPMVYGISNAGVRSNIHNAEKLFNGEAKWNYRDLWIA